MRDWCLLSPGTRDGGLVISSYVLFKVFSIFGFVTGCCKMVRGGGSREMAPQILLFQLNSCDLVPELYNDQLAKSRLQSWRVGSHMPACGI